MRRSVNLVFPLVLFFLAAAVGAQPFPGKPIRILIGFPPGGGIDLVARILGPRVTESLGQQVIVDNRAGANGIIATELAAKAAPDGYTIFFGTTGNLSVNQSLYATLPFSLERDFTPLSQIASVPFLFYVHPSLPAKSVSEFVGHAKANPGRVYFYSSGNGGLPHLAGELLNMVAGIKTVHVPYKGSAPGFNDLLGGQVQFGFDTFAIGLQHVKSGKLRAIATTGSTRSVVLPLVPTVAESLPGFEVVNWYGMVLPAGTPREVIARLHAEFMRALKMPEVRDKMIAQGTDPVGSSPEEFGAFMKSEIVKWGRVIKDANIHSD